MNPHTFIILPLIILLSVSSSWGQQEQDFIKMVKKEAETLTKNGWEAPEGSPTIEEQLLKKYHAEEQTDSVLHPIYWIGDGCATDKKYELAKKKAENNAWTKIANQKSVDLISSIETQTSDSSHSMHSISTCNSQHTFKGKPIILLNLRRKSKDGNQEARIVLAYPRE